MVQQALGGGGSGGGGGGGGSGGGGNGGGGSGGGEGSRRRHTATDPALVLETRSVKLSRRCGSESCGTGRSSGAEDDVSFDIGGGSGGGGGGGCGGGGKGGSGAAWLHVTVEAPRTLIAAARRDAVVRWIRDAYIAALKPHPPQHTLSELQRLARSGGNVAPAPSQAPGSVSLSRTDVPSAAAATETTAGSTARGGAGTPTPSTLGGWSAVKGAMANKLHRRGNSTGVAVFDDNFEVVAGFDDPDGSASAAAKTPAAAAAAAVAAAAAANTTAAATAAAAADTAAASAAASIASTYTAGAAQASLRRRGHTGSWDGGSPAPASAIAAAGGVDPSLYSGARARREVTRGGAASGDVTRGGAASGDVTRGGAVRLS